VAPQRNPNGAPHARERAGSSGFISEWQPRPLSSPVIDPRRRCRDHEQPRAGDHELSVRRDLDSYQSRCVTDLGMLLFNAPLSRNTADVSPSIDPDQAVRSLPTLERWFCGRLIRRQLTRGGYVERETQKYGPTGAVRICSARAIEVYMFVIFVAGVCCAVARLNLASGLCFAVMFILVVLALARLWSAARAGRRWRERSASR
jgi:hypothetical protein